VAKDDIPKAVENLSGTWRKIIDEIIDSCTTLVIILSGLKLTGEMIREIRRATTQLQTLGKPALMFCRFAQVSRTSEQILSELGLDTSLFQQIDWSDPVDLARKVSLEIDDEGRTVRREIPIRRPYSTAEGSQVESAFATLPQQTGLDHRVLELCDIVLNPVWLFPFILTFSMGCFSLYFYTFNAFLVSSLWFNDSEKILILLGVAWSISILYVYRKNGLDSTIRGINQRSVHSMCARVWHSFSRNRLFLKGALLLGLLAIFMTMTDASLGMMSPRVDHIVTEYGSGYSLTGTIADYRILVYVTKTYIIDSPSLWTIDTITIPNPSNYSYSQPSSSCYSDNFQYYAGAPTSCAAITSSIIDPRVQLETQTNASNSIESFDLILSPAPQSYSVSLTMQYSDYIQATSIVAFSGTPSQVSGAVYYREIYVTISNPLGESLSTTQLEVGRYTELLGASCAINGIVEPYGCTNNSTIPNVLSLRNQDIPPGKTVKFAINVTYSGTAYE